MKLHVLYTARNRLEFVKVSFGLMIRNTDWSQVETLMVYDDHSIDGTKMFLEEEVVALNRDKDFPTVGLLHTNLKSPPALMNHFLGHTDCDLFAKIDSDIALPPGWLEAMLGVLEREPEIELLGMEAGQAGHQLDWDGVHRFLPATHIGGVGLIRTERFRHLPAIPADGYFGWTEYQVLYRFERGWIMPDLDVPQLDRIPVEPYRSLSERHREEGWSRKWPYYDQEWSRPYWEWVVKEGLL